MSGVKSKWGIDMKVGDLVVQRLVQGGLTKGMGIIKKVYDNGSTPDKDNRRIWVYWFESGHTSSVGVRWLEVINESR